MEQSEVLGREAALLEQGEGERVADRHGRRRAGGGREPERARLDGDAHVERHVGLVRERRIGVARDRHQGNAEAAGDREQPQHLLALAAVRDGEQDVAPDERADVAVAALAGVQEEGGCAGGGERRGDLAADDARLADAGDDDFAAAGEEQIERAREACVEPVPDGGEGVCLDVEDAPGPVEPLAGHRCPPSLTLIDIPRSRLSISLAHARAARTARSIATSSASSRGNSASGTLVAPSERARLGSSCTSMKTASTPAPTAARASGATKRRSPPDAVPCPPGCCTLCVASNTTGQPVAASTGSARKSATRLL